MMGESTLLQSPFVILLRFGKVIFLPFTEKKTKLQIDQDDADAYDFLSSSA
jgi:hypothetical protein